MSAPVILITGAGGGIGSAVAQRFARAGWRTMLTDRSESALQIASEAAAHAPIYASDLRTATACQDVIDWVMTTQGRLDGIVNAIGIWREGPTEATSESDFDEVFSTNVKSVYFICAAAIAHLKTSEGFITNLSSDAGIQGNTGAALYCASKGAVSLFSKALALELAPFGVRVNAICPGDVLTPMLLHQATSYGGDDPDEYCAALLRGYPQGPGRARFITADEVAALIEYLARPEAKPITGATVSIDFGYSAGK